MSNPLRASPSTTRTRTDSETMPVPGTGDNFSIITASVDHARSRDGLHHLRRTPQISRVAGTHGMRHLPSHVPEQRRLRERSFRLRRMPFVGGGFRHGGLPGVQLEGPISDPDDPDAFPWRTYAWARAPRPGGLRAAGGVPQRRRGCGPAIRTEGAEGARVPGAGRGLRTVGLLRRRRELRSGVQRADRVHPDVRGLMGQMQHHDVQMSGGHRGNRRTEMLQA